MIRSDATLPGFDRLMRWPYSVVRKKSSRLAIAASVA